LRAGHLAPEALEHLVKQTRGVKIQGIPTVKCEACATAKATQVISQRESEHRSRQPFWRISLDLFDLPVAINSHRYAMTITDEFSGFIWVFTMAHKSDSSKIIIDFEVWVKRQFGLSICKIRMDNERTLVNLPNQHPSAFQLWATEDGIDLELPPPYTKQPNGGAERSGGLIGSMARTMRTSASLPQNLWPEAWGAAAYLHNRSPLHRHGWKSPLEVFERWFRNHFRWWQPLNNTNVSLIQPQPPEQPELQELPQQQDPLKPSWSGIHAYGSRAYPLNTEIKAGHGKRHFKVNPRAHIGYLVGYRASNLYRIWVPALEEVITTRDVRFDETTFFDPRTENAAISIEEYHPLPETLATPDFTVPEDLDIDIFVANEESAVPQRDEIPMASGPETVPTAPITTPESQNSGVNTATRPTAATQSTGGLPTPQDKQQPIGLPPPEPTTPSPASLLPDDVRTGTAPAPPSPETSTDDDGIRDTIVVNTGLSDEESLSQPNATIQQHLDPSPGSSGAVPDEDTPISADGTTAREGIGPSQPQGQSQRRQRRPAADIHGTEPTRRSSRAPQPNRRYPPSSFWILGLTSCTTVHAVFAAAIQGDHRPHRDQLTREPKHYKDLHQHPHGQLFKEACRTELRNLLRKKTWSFVNKEAIRVGPQEGSKPLPLKWVFLYKFDEDGYLLKCKGRICVRGDLQEADLNDTYSATLAAQSFRVAMSVAARFDLDVKQYDVTNAFLHSKINKEHGRVFCKLPDGYEELMGLPKGATNGFVAELEMALYGLKESPLLWYNEFSSALQAAGLSKANEEPCIFTNGRVLVLFYVDDILVFYRKEEQQEANQLIAQLQQKYEMRSEGDIKWFLGIRVLRDRERRRVWLCHDAYCEKITAKFGLLTNGNKTRFPTIPLPVTPLQRYDGQATRTSIHLFQEKVGSILYTAVTVRLDVAFAAAQLSKFLQNPSPEHHAAADQVILYLYATRFLAIEYNGAFTDALVIASDASFADDPETRHSSQGYVISLFGGPVAWKAGKQSTVTTSTTEAELLAAERTIKESLALSRLMEDIGLELGVPLKIWCDNQQTIRLIVHENQRIATRLKHVDIQNMWMRQEYRKGRFQIGYLATADMPADGLTKALSRQRFEHFRSLLHLADVQEQIQALE